MATTDIATITALLTRYLRAPATVNVDPDGGVTATFNPALTAGEQATFDSLAASFQSPALVSPEVFAGVKPQIAEIRGFRQRTLATWNGLTAAQRQADQIQYLNDLTDVLRALLR